MQFQEQNSLKDEMPSFKATPNTQGWVEEAEKWLSLEQDNLTVIRIAAKVEDLRYDLKKLAKEKAEKEAEEAKAKIEELRFRPSKRGRGYVAFAGSMIVFSDDIPARYPLSGAFRNTGKPVFQVGKGPHELTYEKSHESGRFGTNESIEKEEMERGAKFCTLSRRHKFTIK